MEQRGRPPHAALEWGNFAVRWQGLFGVPDTMQYRFTADTKGTGTVTLRIDGADVNANGGTRQLTEGLHDIELAYVSAAGQQQPNMVLRLEWAGVAGVRRTAPAYVSGPIPDYYFFEIRD